MKTEPTVKRAIEKIAREAQATISPENFGAPSALVEGKMFPDPDGNTMYMYLKGVRYKWTIATG